MAQPPKPWPELEALVRANYNYYVHLARCVCRSDPDAREVVQDALRSAVEKRHSFDETRGTLSGWVAKVVRNRARDAARASTRSAARCSGDDVDNEADKYRPSVETVLLSREDDQRVQEALGTLSEKERNALTQHHGEHTSYGEIAAELGVTPDVVSGWAHRGAAKFMRHPLIRQLRAERANGGKR